MADRSGLCHGPHCRMPIEPWGPSEDFCSVSCQERWHAEANGSTAGVVQRDGLYFIETDNDRNEAWQSVMRRYAWLVDADTVRIRPRPDYHNPMPRMVLDGSLPPGEIQLRDSKTGATLARITNIGPPVAPEPPAETGGEALSRRPWWRRWSRR